MACTPGAKSAICGFHVSRHCVLCVNAVQAVGSFPESSRIITDSGNLTVINLSPDDHGVYECVAASVVSSVITTTLLIIERKYAINVYQNYRCEYNFYTLIMEAFSANYVAKCTFWPNVHFCINYAQYKYGTRFFTARSYARAVDAVVVCPSVCPSHVGIVSKRISVGYEHMKCDAKCGKSGGGW